MITNLKISGLTILISAVYFKMHRQEYPTTLSHTHTRNETLELGKYIYIQYILIYMSGLL
jgi:hypothetical protein